VAYTVYAKSIPRTYWQNTDTQKSVYSNTIKAFMILLLPLWKDRFTNSINATVDILRTIYESWLISNNLTKKKEYTFDSIKDHKPLKKDNNASHTMLLSKSVFFLYSKQKKEIDKPNIIIKELTSICGLSSFKYVKSIPACVP
jgi:hypothetical protein